jgi:hypothetical protein
MNQDFRPAARDIEWLMIMKDEPEIRSTFTEEELNMIAIREWVDNLPQHSGVDDGLTPSQRLKKMIPLMDRALDIADQFD